MDDVKQGYREAEDKARVKIGRISENGTLEITRQRLRQAHRLVSQTPCPHCAGTGMVRDPKGLATAAMRELTNKLTHPKYGHEKEYRVLLARRPDQEQLDAWRRGVILEDGYKTAPVEVRFESAQGKGAWVRVIMKEGRKRQIRETCRQLGLPIVRIVRIRIGSLRLGNLKPRQWRYLTMQEVDALKRNEPKRTIR